MECIALLGKVQVTREDGGSCVQNARQPVRAKSSSCPICSGLSPKPSINVELNIN